MTKIFAIIKITRPVNLVITFISIVIAAIICSYGVFARDKVIFAAVSGALAAAAGNIINDLFDIEIDKINRPDRPLASNILTMVKQFLFLLFFAFIFIVFLLYK